MKKYLCLVLLCLATVFQFASCSEEDDEYGGGSSASNIRVSITNISKGNKNHGKYTYKVSVKATGTSAEEVKDIGVSWGPTSSASGKRSGTRGTTRTVRSINLSSGSTFFLKPFVVTSAGSKEGKVQRVRVPK